MTSILVTGATGFLGQSIVDFVLNSDDFRDFSLIMQGHSEKRSDVLRRKYSLPVIVGDINDDYFLRQIFSQNKIDVIIHTAAIKYVSVSNENPLATIKTNIVSSYNISKYALMYDIKNVVAISTDKAINPTNLYGMSKKIMEDIFLSSGFTVVSGVNFFGSSGSVLDVWYNQMSTNKPLTVTDKNCIRYFVEIDQMVNLIFDNLKNKGLFYPNEVKEVKLGDLLDSFMNKFNYFEFTETGLLPGEKIVEEISSKSAISSMEKFHLDALVDEWQKNKLSAI